MSSSFEDPPPSGTDLSQLSRHVLRGDPDSADVAQEVWILFQRRTPGQLHAPRAWLAVTMRNLSLRLRRRETGRKLRERLVARPEAVPSVDEDLEREARRAFAHRVIEELPEPYRQVATMRYLEEREIDDIARLLDRSPGTVRSQLKRGLDRLKLRLGEEQRRSFWGPLALLLGRRGSPRKAPSATVWVSMLACASAVTLLGVATWLHGARPQPMETWAAGVAAQPADVPLMRAASPALRPRVTPEIRSITRSQPSFDMQVAGTVLDVEGRPVAGAAIRVAREDREETDEATLVTHSDRQGRYSLRRVDRRNLIWAEAEGLAASSQHQLASKPDGALDLHLGFPLGSLLGRVLDAEGVPVTNGQVAWLATAFEPVALELGDQGTRERPAPPAAFPISADGSFRLTAPRQDSFRLLVTVPGQPPLVTPLRATSYPQELELTLLAPARIEGRFESDGARSLAGVRFELLLPEPHLARQVTTDSSGRFHLDALPPGPFALRLVDDPADASTSSYSLGELRAGETLSLAVTSDTRTLVQGRATQLGQAASGWVVELEEVGRQGFSLDRRRVRTGADGRFLFRSCSPSNAYWLRLYAPDEVDGPPAVHAMKVSPGEEGIEMVVEAVLPLGSLVGRFVSDAPDRLPTLIVLKSRHLSAPILLPVDGRDGSFRADDLGAWDYRALALLPGMAPWDLGEIRIRSEETSAVDFRVPTPGGLAIDFQFEVGAESRHLAVLLRIMAFDDQARTANQSLERDRKSDRITVELLPRTYEYTVELDGARYRSGQVEILPGRTSQERIRVENVVLRTLEVGLEHRLLPGERTPLTVRTPTGENRVFLGYAARQGRTETFQIALPQGTRELDLTSSAGREGHLDLRPEDLEGGAPLRIELRDPPPR